MTKVTCAISGLEFDCEHFGNNIPNYPALVVSHTEGYFHPIFAAPYMDLYKFYHYHSKGTLTKTDSYLLFLAFLHSSGQIMWDNPVSLDPLNIQTTKLIENNFHQLVATLEKTNLIRHTGFEQPSFRVTFENSKLEQIHNWIEAWEDNLADFKITKADIKIQEDFNTLTAKLSYHILSNTSPEEYSAIIAEWACKAASFPPHLETLWIDTIKSCFHITKMFNTPLSLLKEIKEYCECNIEAGSIHFHDLMKVLREGISRHVDYLGGSTLALGYTLLPKPPADIEAAYMEADEKLLSIAAKAPESEPEKKDYPNQLEWLRAKLAYRVASRTFKNDLPKEL